MVNHLFQEGCNLGRALKGLDAATVRPRRVLCRFRWEAGISTSGGGQDSLEVQHKPRAGLETYSWNKYNI